MSPADWEKIQAIVDAALDLPAAERASFLERECQDAQLRRRAEAMIDAHERAGDFLDAPISERASELLAGKPGTSIPAIAAGQDILGYRVLSEIGSGGMGVVLKAEDPVLHRPVALKLLAPERLGGASVNRLIREAQAASSLNHPNIVTIHGVLQSDAMVAIVMEFVDGASLRQICAGPLPVAEAIGIVRQIALALAAAHEAGIIHRDVKPENVVVRSDGYVKVVDFGLARNVTLADSATSKSITAGTLRYMSPEQLRGERLTPASDMFSLGLLLYEITVGKHPFAATSALDAAWGITHDTPARPSSERPDFPAELEEFILALLAKEPVTRPSARELANSLQRMEQPPALPQRERPPIFHSIKWKALAAASAVVLILIVGAWWWSPKPRPAAPSSPDQIVRAQGLNDPIPPRHVYAIDPQGRLFIYVDNSSDAGGYKNWIAERAATPPIAAVNWASFKQVFASGDGVIYALTPSGELKYFRLLDVWRNKGHQRWSADSGRTIGTNLDRFAQLAALSSSAWTFADGRKLISRARLIRGGVIWAIDRSGRASLFQHGWNEQGEVLPLSAAGLDFTSEYVPPSLPPGNRCSGCQVIEAGDGIAYGISRDGKFWRYRWRADGTYGKAAGSFASADGIGAEIGHDWQGLRVFAAPGDYSIEGYVQTEKPGKTTAVSLRPGDRVKLAVSTFSPIYTVRLLRLQRRTDEDRGTPSGLIDGVAVGQPQTFTAPAGATFKKARRAGMYGQGAGWASDGAGFVLPRSAKPGIYAAELTTPSGGRHLAPFVVGPTAGAKPKNIAVIANVTTWNAYNQWGGCSRDLLFEAAAAAGATCELSFDRPLLDPPLIGGVRAATGLTDRNPRAFNQSVRAEIWIHTWLDSLALEHPQYEYDVFSDIDLHAGISSLGNYKALVIQTLPEFWTDGMRDHLDQYLNGGGHLVYLGGRALYDRVAITASGKLRIRTVPARDLFRWPSASHPDGRSERAVLGVAREREDRVGDPFLTGQPYVVNEPHPFLSKYTNLDKHSVFGKVRGLNNNMAAADWDLSWYQSGGECPDAPGHLCSASHMTLAGTLLASAPGDSHSNGNSTVVYRRTEAGSGWVFSIGSLSFGGALAIDETLQRVVRNALDAAITEVAP
jgi:serine/threonine protein kinase